MTKTDEEEVSDSADISKADADKKLSSDTEADDRQDDRPRMRRRVSQTGRLSTRGEFNFGIPTQVCVQEHIEEFHGTHSWRWKILRFIHKPKVQVTMMVLLLLDVVILFVELFLLTQYPRCEVIERDCISCCEATGGDSAHNSTRFLSGDSHEAEICEAGLEPNYETGSCDPNKWHTIHVIEKVLFGFTIAILSTFFIELNLQMVALRPEIFFRQLFYVMDYTIVTVSLALELSLHFIEEDSLAALLGLLVFARIWRFIRIGHGIVEVTSELTHRQYETLLEYTEGLEKAMQENNLRLPKRPTSVEVSLKEQHSTSLPSPSPHISSGSS